MLVYTITLPAPLVSDVVTRELTIAGIPGVETETLSVLVDQVTIEGKQAPQDTALTLTLVDIDDGGNRSEPRVQEVILKDTIAPPLPGELGVTVTGEI